MSSALQLGLSVAWLYRLSRTAYPVPYVCKEDPNDLLGLNLPYTARPRSVAPVAVSCPGGRALRRWKVCVLIHSTLADLPCVCRYTYWSKRGMFGAS